MCAIFIAAVALICIAIYSTSLHVAPHSLCQLFYSHFALVPLNLSPSQITTSLEQQATESSLCERNNTGGLSAQGKVSRL